MSYILDALKRADAERERGAAPGLHTRHQVPESSPGTTPTRRNIGLALAGGLLLVLLALVFWEGRAPDASPSASALMPPPPASLPVPAPLPVPVPAPVVVDEVPKAQALPLAAASVAKPLDTPDAKPVSQTAAPATAPVSAPATPPKPAPAAIPLLAELPQDLRNQMPKITITGSVYSDSPAQRLLLVNNLVLPQGSQVASDLTLEEIQPRSSVFSFKGTRFRVKH